MNLKTRQFLTQTIAVILLIIIVMCVLLFPKLISSQSELVPISFAVSGQSGNEETVILRGHFDKDIKENATLWLYAENAGIQLRVHGETYHYNERGNTPLIFRSPGSGWYGFLSPGLNTSDEAELTIHSYYSESGRAAGNLFSRLYVGDGGGLYRLMLGQIDLFAVVLICALFAGLLYMMEGIIDIQQGAHSEGSRIGIFGAYCFTGGIWCVTDAIYPYVTLLVVPRCAAAFIDVMGLILFPIALAAMMHFYIRGSRTRKVMGVVVVLEVIMAALCLIRQFTGQADLIEQQFSIGIVAIAVLGTAIVCIAVDLWHYRDSYLFLLFLTVLPVFIAVALDGINILFPFMPQRTVMRYGFSLSVFMLILQIVSYARTESAKAEKMHNLESELADSRISVMLSQIQPHFLYNALVGIKELCDTGEQQTTSRALEHFAYYLRGNMSSLSDKRLIPFAQEVSHVKDYLYLEKIRFEEKCCIVWELNVTDFLLPCLTLQPIVENAVRHGITEKKCGGTLTIRSEETDDHVVITVADDGVGFDTTEALNDGRTHIGIGNVRKRLAAQCGGSLHIESERGTGTTVKIILPETEGLEYENHSGGR